MLFRSVAIDRLESPDTLRALARNGFRSPAPASAEGRAILAHSDDAVLDEFLELQTFENFPNLRRVLHELVDALEASPNRYVLGSRYSARTMRLLRHASSRFEIVHLPAFTPADAPPARMPNAAKV